MVLPQYKVNPVPQLIVELEERGEANEQAGKFMGV